jgi:hypothetical protein
MSPKVLDTDNRPGSTLKGPRIKCSYIDPTQADEDGFYVPIKLPAPGGILVNVYVLK